MKKLILVSLALACLATPALALSYPVQGRYGLSNKTAPGPIDCTGKRVIDFASERRFDSGGGVPDFRAINVVRNGNTAFRITEEFHTGQIRAQNKMTLRLVDPDRVELALARGGTLKLKRCL